RRSPARRDGALQRVVRPRRLHHHGRQSHGCRRPPAGRPHDPRRAGPGLLVRDFTKWDDNPQSLQHFAESMVRAYKVTMTPPYEPVLMAVEEKLQEEAIEKGP